jgi:hypothetical protein
MLSNSRKFAFIDAEFTGEHQKTTLVSLAVVGDCDEQIYLTFNGYECDQVTPWLEKNVLRLIDTSKSVSYADGYKKLSSWFDEYSAGDLISLVSVGKTLDLVLLFELWHHGNPDRKYFHNLHCLPEYLNHSAHFDLPTIFWLAGLSPDLNREELAGQVTGHRHEALHDALVVRECFRRCIDPQRFPILFKPPE